MTLICVCSAKGSPGATLSALGLAAAWPSVDGHRKLLVEADSAGGALAIRYRLPTTPGLLSLAARAASGMEASHLWASAQHLPGGLPAVLAPDRPDQVVAATRSLGSTFARWLSEQRDITAIVDIGRIGVDPSLHAFAAAADAVLVVARPVAEQLRPATHLFGVVPDGVNVGWLLIGDQPYSAPDVVAAYGRPVAGVLPLDARAARSLETGSQQSRLRRSLLVRAFSDLAGRLHDLLHSGPVPSTDPPPMPISVPVPNAVPDTLPDTLPDTVDGGR